LRSGWKILPSTVSSESVTGSSVSSNNWASGSDSDSSNSGGSDSDGAVGGDNSSGSNLGVGSDNGGGVGLLDRLLGTGGADGLSTVLDDLDVNDFLADGLGDLPGSADGYVVAGLDWHALTDGGRGDNGAGVPGNVSGISVGISISFWLGVGITLSISSLDDSSTTNNSSSDNSSNSAVSSGDDSSGGDSMSDGDGRSGDNSGSDDLGVGSYDGRALSGLGAGLLAGGGDGFFAMLGDGGVDDLVVFLMANFSWGFDGPVLADFFGDRFADWSGDGSGSDGSVSSVNSGIGISIGFGLGLGFSSHQESLGKSNETKESKEFHDDDEVVFFVLLTEMSSHQILE